MEHLSNDHKYHPNQYKNSHKLCYEMAYPIVNLMESPWKLTWKPTTWSEFPNGGKATAKQVVASEERNNLKKAGLWESVWDPSRNVNHLSKFIWDRKIITEFTRSISSTRIGKPVLMMDVKVSKNKNISRWIDWENLIYVRSNRIKNRAQRRRRWSVEEEVRHWVKWGQSKT